MAWWETKQKVATAAPPERAAATGAPIPVHDSPGEYVVPALGRKIKLLCYHDRIVRIASDDPTPFRLQKGEEALIKGAAPAVGTEGDGEVQLRINGHLAYRASRAALADLSKRLGALDQSGAATAGLMAAVNGVRDRIAARRNEGASGDDLAALLATDSALSALVDAWGKPTLLEKCHYIYCEHELTVRCELPDGSPAPGRIALDVRMLCCAPATK